MYRIVLQIIVHKYYYKDRKIDTSFVSLELQRLGASITEFFHFNIRGKLSMEMRCDK